MANRFSRRLAFLGLCLLAVGCSSKSGGGSAAPLHDPNVEIRRAAVRALGQQSEFDSQSITALSGAVADDDAEVRRLSIDALRKAGPTAASSVPALTKALQDSDSSVRLKAALAIQKIDPKNTSFAPVLIAAMRAGDGKIMLEVGAMGKDAAWAVPTLVGLLSHDLPQVRALAAQTLGRIGPVASEAKPALQHALRDSNAAVRTAAQGALDQMQPQSAGAAKK